MTWAELSRPRRSAAERSAHARLAATSRWARTTPDERRAATAPARRGLQARFDAAPNPKAARAQHMAAMSVASLRSRRAS